MPGNTAIKYMLTDRNPITDIPEIFFTLKTTQVHDSTSSYLKLTLTFTGNVSK